MPKIFALRDRLQAVQEYLIDAEDELQIFPGKHFPPAPARKELKCPLPLGERDLNSSLVANDIGTFKEALIPEEHFFKIDDIEHQDEEVFNLTNNVPNQSLEILTDSQPKDESKVLISDEYQKQSAIETSTKQKELPEESHENSNKVLMGKCLNTMIYIKMISIQIIQNTST